LKRLILLFLILTAQTTNAITLTQGTILNTSNSNSSMTFSLNITCDKLIIESVNVTLYNVTCLNTRTYNKILWDTPNKNNDSLSYCEVTITEEEDEDGEASGTSGTGDLPDRTIDIKTDKFWYLNNTYNITMKFFMGTYLYDPEEIDFDYNNSILTFTNLTEKDLIYNAIFYVKPTAELGETKIKIKMQYFM